MYKPTTFGIARPASRLARARRRKEIDELMDHYVSWRENCAAVAVACQTWRTAEPESRNRAFVMYSAALDREDEQASRYQVAVARVTAT